MSAVQGLIDLPMLDRLQSFLWVVDLHGDVLVDCVSGNAVVLPESKTYGHDLLLGSSCGVVFRRSALSRLSRFSNSQIGRNDGNQRVKVLPNEQDLRQCWLKQVATPSVPGIRLEKQ